MLESAYLTLLGVFEYFFPPAVAQAAVLLLAFILVAWVVESVDALIGHRLDALGIRPRTFSGLLGIALAPFLHGGFGHLAANTVPLFVLGCFVALGDPGELLLVTVTGWAVSGFGAWLLGASRTRHIGASGLVFTYLGFIVALAVTRQSPLAIALALAAVGLYGGLIWGVLPLRKGRSWQSHLFGLLAGVGCAIYLVPLRDSMAADAMQAIARM